MLLVDDLLLAPGKAVVALFEQLAKRAQEEFLDDAVVKQELHEIHALVEAGRISDTEFETKEARLLERLAQITRAKLQGGWAGLAALPAPTEADIADIAAFARELATPAIDTIAIPRNLEPDVIDTVAVEREAPLALELAGPPHDVNPPVIDTVPVAPDFLRLPVEPAAAVPGPAPASVATAPAALSGRVTMPQAVEGAMRGLAMLKMKVSSITCVVPSGEGWQVTVELVERRGVPDTSDLLGVYETFLDAAGNVLRYERTRIRRRCDVGG